MDDIIIFRDKCKVKPKKEDDIMKDPSVQDAISKAKQQKMLQKLKTNIDNEPSKSEPEDIQLKKAQLRFWRALDKERQFEDRKLKEEELKEKMEQENIKKQLDCEKNKTERLLNTIISTKKAKDMKKKLETKKQLDQMNQELKQKLLKSRKLLAEKLYRMKKTHERTINVSRQKMNDYHAMAATSLISAEKKGDMANCKPSNPLKDREKYCNDNFNDSQSYFLLKDCMNEKQYCDVCCEHEFGDMHLDKKELCKAQCDIKIELTQVGGKWVYVEDNKGTESESNVEKASLDNNLPIKINSR